MENLAAFYKKIKRHFQQLTSQRFPLGSPKVYRVPMPEPAVKQSGTEISYFFLKMTY